MGKVISVDLLWIFCLFGILCVHHHIYLRSFSCAWFASDVLAKCIFDVYSIKLITHSVFHISFIGYLVSESMFCFCAEHNSFGGLVLLLLFFLLSAKARSGKRIFRPPVKPCMVLAVRFSICGSH